MNNYLDCLNQQGQPPDHLLNGCKGGSGMYEEASPKNENWSYPTTPPFFLANAGGPITQHDDKDLSPLQLAVDFDAHLQGLNYDEGTNLNLCIVDGTGHATGFLDAWDPVDPTKQRRCEGDTGEVIESIVSFYVSFLES